MRITDVKVIKANRCVFAKIETDEGIYGIGEAGAWGFLPACGTAIESYKSYLVGKNPLDIEHHWQVMQRFGHFRGAVVMGAVSAIDIALYDIAGKFHGVPVYRLLGGKCRNKIRVYNHTAGQTEEQLVKNAVKGKKDGFTALGHLNPFLDEPRSLPFHDNNTELLYKAEKRVAAVREAVGDEIDLCLELHRRLEPGLAIQLSHALEKYHPTFLEDPIRPDNYDEMARVAAHSNIPIATGERISSFFDFAALIEKGACSYIRASIGVCGGFTGALKIAHLAEAHHLSLVPHNPLSPVTTNATLQFAAAVENIFLCEYPDPYKASTADNLMGTGVPLRQVDMVTEIPECNGGYISVPDKPGIGIDLVENVDKKFPFRPHTIDTRLNLDGSVCDQ